VLQQRTTSLEAHFNIDVLEQLHKVIVCPIERSLQSWRNQLLFNTYLIWICEDLRCHGTNTDLVWLLGGVGAAPCWGSTHPTGPSAVQSSSCLSLSLDSFRSVQSFLLLTVQLNDYPLPRFRPVILMLRAATGNPTSDEKGKRPPWRCCSNCSSYTNLSKGEEGG
jgi:hypothetical protein